MFKNAVIIDDDPINNFLCEKVLGTSDEVERAKSFDNPLEALVYLKLKAAEYDLMQDFPDLILLDLNMPQLDGWNFLEEYRSLPNNVTQNTKLYILTSSVDDRDKKRASKVNFLNGFISKPLTIETVKTLRNFNRFMPA